ncbi:MAG: class I SAM-dependent methyltransferase [Bacteroidetes bacterium]|nr:MAG: class I SAM-dependent methyltransferase [Bacteroidota bacterium]
MPYQIDGKIHFEKCIICNSNAVKKVLSAKDETVSGENFDIWECDNCKLRFTQNIPTPSEIGRYYKSDEYISHSDTQKGLINSLYHSVRTKTLASKKKLIEKATGLKNGKILDLGCGTGAFLNVMKNGGWEVLGIEPDEGARTKAESLYHIRALPTDEVYKLGESIFDAITLWHVLEHVHELHEYLKILHQALKPEGKLFVAVPNYTSWDAEFYDTYWAAYDVPRHLYHFSPRSMKILLTDHLFHLEEIQPMWYDSYYVSMLSEKYKHGKTDYINAFFNGWKSNRIARKLNERASSLIYVSRKSDDIKG